MPSPLIWIFTPLVQRMCLLPLTPGCSKWVNFVPECSRERGEFVRHRGPLKSRGSGSTAVPLCAPDMKHRTRPLWSWPTCQSALHWDCLLPALMCRTDRPRACMQSLPEWRKRHVLMTGVSIHAHPRGRITMATSGVGQAWVYYSIFRVQLASTLPKSALNV